ncbi:carboxylesterase NA [hydrothermal vent metagenome]|uniref:Carboxylesterase NA n=1 Tax=hydrothermal vent metagenome TaxID=652676 RepID=A0A3B1C1F4_9ZZZZ
MEMSAHHPFRSARAKEQYLKLYDMRAKKWPVVSEPRMVETSYGQTFVRVSGADGAPPLVLLHGMGGNSLQWVPNVKDLSTSYKTYAVDNIYDNGRSIYSRAIEGSNDFVNWLDELFSALQLGNNINIVGLSYGGWLTTQYALRFPERLDKIVLLAPVGTVLPLQLKWIIRAILCVVPHRYFTKSFIYWLVADLAKKDEASRVMVEELVDDAFMAIRSFKLKRMVNPTVLEDTELQKIKVPALYLVGENEKIYSAQKAIQRLNKVAPHIRAEVIPNAGHDLTSVQSEMVNKKILEFLK